MTSREREESMQIGTELGRTAHRDDTMLRDHDRALTGLQANNIDRLRTLLQIRIALLRRVFKCGSFTCARHLYFLQIVTRWTRHV